MVSIILFITDIFCGLINIIYNRFKNTVENIDYRIKSVNSLKFI